MNQRLKAVGQHVAEGWIVITTTLTAAAGWSATVDRRKSGLKVAAVLALVVGLTGCGGAQQAATTAVPSTVTVQAPAAPAATVVAPPADTPTAGQVAAEKAAAKKAKAAKKAQAARKAVANKARAVRNAKAAKAAAARTAKAAQKAEAARKAKTAARYDKVGMMVASLDAGYHLDRSDSKIRPYTRLLDRLQTKCKEPRIRLADFAVWARATLKDQGTSTTLKELLAAAVTGTQPIHGYRINCNEIFATIVVASA